MPVIYRSNPPERGTPKAPAAPAPAPVITGHTQAERVYSFLAAIARAGAPCPSTTDIFCAVELSSGMQAHQCIQALARAGRIRIHPVSTHRRVIEIAETGARTAPTALRTYPRVVARPRKRSQS